VPAWRFGRRMIGRQPGGRAPVRCCAWGGWPAGRRGRRPVRRQRGGCRRRSRGVRCSTVVAASGASRRWRARRRCGGRTGVAASRARPSSARRGRRPWLLRRGADLAGAFVGQAPVPLVDVGFHPWMQAPLLGDVVGAHGGLVVHAPGPVRRGAADLGLHAVDAQGHAVGLSVGEHVGPGTQPQPGPVRDGKAAPGEQGADLAGCLADGGAADALQLGRCGMRQVRAQVDQGEHDAVGEDQLLFRVGPRRPEPLVAAPCVQCRLAQRTPRPGQLLGQIAEMFARDAGEGRVGQGRAGPLFGHRRRTRAARSASRPVRALMVDGRDGRSPRSAGTP